MNELKFRLLNKQIISTQNEWVGYEYVFRATHPHVENSKKEFAEIHAFLYVNSKQVDRIYKACDYVIKWYSLIDSNNQRLDAPKLIWTISDKGIKIPFTYNEDNYSELLNDMMDIAFSGRVKIRRQLKENTNSILQRTYQAIENSSNLNTNIAMGK